ncbi:hypothetical protein P7D85_09710 [Enterococcus hulanensis]|uniref:Glycosyltransferase n=1 Tax=Enterococcus hulanensis TaxID=2559929 RepID=A0ABU3EYU9_9ENTE|nr:hypothetical protein [Enterococcus hulanensis]MDT2600052.1 hypothetical protein [Enterococcus hulanensis]MDT2610126.1 hypothetical protein [Enterococcus hulanensis]MDT2617934.1 hypothetical protein [Enterococcus hulanensis]MDT2629904.1 hypothetical protein [Enterococcus hulanensis]MDT2656499.1 hypothetical protein [Enterococcus hulanensis]
MKIAVVYRIYRWDEANQLLLERVKACIGEAQLVVLADESNGRLPVPEEYTIVRYTKDMGDYQLPSEPEHNCLWWNVDYGLYVLKDTIDADFYWMLDHDVILPTRFPEIIEDVSKRKTDFVASHIRNASGTWRWYKTGELMDINEPMKAALLMIFGVSRKAINALYNERTRIWKEIKKHDFHLFPRNKWPFCEVLLPNVLRESNNYKVQDLLDYRPDFNFSKYRVAHAKSVYDHSHYTENDFVHPVLTPEKALTRLRRLTPYQELFDENSTLRKLITEITERDNPFFSELYSYYKEQGIEGSDNLKLIALAKNQKWV